MKQALKCAGGIRTHGLELMRLARTASPLPRICPAGVEPAVSGSRNRRGGRLPHEQSVPPAGLEPAASRLRAGRPSPFDHGGVPERVGDPGIEPGPARYQRAVPPRTPVSGGELRRQASNLLLASNSRASCPLDHAGMMVRKGGRRGSRTPKAARPTRFRDGIPRRWQSFRTREVDARGRAVSCPACLRRSSFSTADAFARSR